MIDLMEEGLKVRDVISIIGAVSAAIVTLVAEPQWPTVALILLVILMGYIIWRMLRARLSGMEDELQKCHEAHAECSDRFQTVLERLSDHREQTGLPERRESDKKSGPFINPDHVRRRRDKAKIKAKKRARK